MWQSDDDGDNLHAAIDALHCNSRFAVSKSQRVVCWDKSVTGQAGSDPINHKKESISFAELHWLAHRSSISLGFRDMATAEFSIIITTSHLASVRLLICILFY
jgi:hypothetical protein